MDDGADDGADVVVGDNADKGLTWLIAAEFWDFSRCVASLMMLVRVYNMGSRAEGLLMI